MSAHSAKGGGPAHTGGFVTPKFNSISPASGQSYLASARKYCLQTLSEVVSTFCKGVLPIELLEIPLPYDKRNMLGRKGGRYADEDGSLMTADQTVADWRKQLISKTREEKYISNISSYFLFEYTKQNRLYLGILQLPNSLQMQY